MKMLIYIIVCTISASAIADNRDQFIKEQFSGSSLIHECQNNKEFLSKKFEVICADNFHQYVSKKPSSSRGSKPPAKVRIGEFNALHPGMNKTRFKDYKRVAMLIEKFDIIGVTELIPLMSIDLENNEDVMEFIEEAPLMISHTQKEIAYIKKQLQASNRGKESKEREIKLLNKKLLELKEDLADAASLYRLPGYLKILDELHKRPGGKKWSLILSPKGEGSELTSTPELVGYYYRSDLVEPQDNQYCRSSNKSNNPKSFACIVNMDQIDLGVDKSKYFARRPFMGQFKAGNFEFILLTSHILYDSPEDESTMRSILNAAFGVDDYTELGTGLRKDNYARFAEVKMTFEFIKRYLRKYSKIKDLIYLGDFNIEAQNPFWSNILPDWKGSQVFIEEATSLKEQFWAQDGTPSGGMSSNYDHIIFNPKETSECMSRGKFDGAALNFMKGSVGNSLNRTYKVRYKYNGTGNININTKKYNSVIDRYVDPYFDGRENIVTIGRKYINVGKYRKISRGIVIDERETEDYGVLFRERVVDSQLSLDSFYYFYEQLMSDHLPVYVDCKI